MSKLNLLKKTQIYDQISTSTQQRERRFTRRSPRQKSNQRLRGKTNESNGSDESLSKFYVKNVNNSTPGNIEEMLKRQIDLMSPPKRRPTPVRQRRLIINYQNKQQNIDAKLNNQKRSATHNEYQKNPRQLQLIIQKKDKQIAAISSQIEKYKQFIHKNNQKLKQVTKQLQQCKKQNQKLQCDLVVEKNNTRNLVKQINLLKEKNYQKQILLEIYEQEELKSMQLDQKQKLKKLKNSIFKSRVLEYQKERQLLWDKIRLMQSSLAYSQSAPGNSPHQNNNGAGPNYHQGLINLIPNTQQYGNISCQLYNANKQIQRLKIHEQHMQRKFYLQYQILRQKRQREYEQLKKRYTQLLDKFKKCMKTMTSLKIRSMKSNAFVSQQKNKGQLNSQADISFNISQDENQTTQRSCVYSLSTQLNGNRKGFNKNSDIMGFSRGEKQQVKRNGNRVDYSPRGTMSNNHTRKVM